MRAKRLSNYDNLTPEEGGPLPWAPDHIQPEAEAIPSQSAPAGAPKASAELAIAKPANPEPQLAPAETAPIGVATKPEKFPYFHSYSNVTEAGVLTNPNQKHGPTALVPIPTTAYHPPQIDQQAETPAQP